MTLQYLEVKVKAYLSPSLHPFQHTPSSSSGNNRFHILAVLKIRIEEMHEIRAFYSTFYFHSLTPFYAQQDNLVTSLVNA